MQEERKISEEMRSPFLLLRRFIKWTSRTEFPKSWRLPKVPTRKQAALLDAYCKEYISLVNDIVNYAEGQGGMPRKLTSASVHSFLPSALRNQCCIDARSVYQKCRKTGRLHVLRKPMAIWNNQNYEVGANFIAMTLWANEADRKSHVRTHIRAIILPETTELLERSKLGTLRITRKSGKYIAQVAYDAPSAAPVPGDAMGVDLGIKCPAVAVTDGGKVRFFGNGRQRRQIRRQYHSHRKKLGKAKKLNAIRKSQNKEQRWMRDQDHKLSRQIVNFAVANGVSTIKLEELSGIRRTTRRSRKNDKKTRSWNRELSSWSFYRLASFIEYKAQLAGIEVVYINPAYTSQACPGCGTRHHAEDRLYVCPDCGYRAHWDLVGARNILVA